MNISRLSFSIPVLCIDNFLPEVEADTVLRECIELKPIYMPARVFDGLNDSRVDDQYRRNEVVYLDEVFRGAPERSQTLRLLKTRLWDDQCRAIWHEGYTIFDIINYCTHQESVLSRYGTGEFYEKHQDTRWDQITHRIVSMIYYVNREPPKFTGGLLRIWNNDESLAIEPRHNRAIIFPSFAFHEVEPVRSSGADWEDARFSLNHWMGFR